MQLQQLQRTRVRGGGVTLWWRGEQRRREAGETRTGAGVRRISDRLVLELSLNSALIEPE